MFHLYISAKKSMLKSNMYVCTHTHTICMLVSVVMTFQSFWHSQTYAVIKEKKSRQATMPLTAITTIISAKTTPTTGSPTHTLETTYAPLLLLLLSLFFVCLWTLEFISHKPASSGALWSTTYIPLYLYVYTYICTRINVSAIATAAPLVMWCC